MILKSNKPRFCQAAKLPGGEVAVYIAATKEGEDNDAVLGFYTAPLGWRILVEVSESILKENSWDEIIRIVKSESFVETIDPAVQEVKWDVMQVVEGCGMAATWDKWQIGVLKNI